MHIQIQYSIFILSKRAIFKRYFDINIYYFLLKQFHANGSCSCFEYFDVDVFLKSKALYIQTQWIKNQKLLRYLPLSLLDYLRDTNDIPWNQNVKWCNSNRKVIIFVLYHLLFNCCVLDQFHLSYHYHNFSNLSQILACIHRDRVIQRQFP